MPQGAQRNLNRPNGVTKVVSSWLSGSNGHWALSAAMSATAWAGVSDWYLSLLTYRLRRDRSTHIRMALEFFLGAMTMGTHHAVGSVTDSMISCTCKRSRSAFNFSQYAIWMVRGGVHAKGFGVICQRYAKQFSFHVVYLPIKDGWELHHH